MDNAHGFDVERVFNTILKQVDGLRCRQRFYGEYYDMFTKYLRDRAVTESGHFIGCLKTVVSDSMMDACGCRHDLRVYPYEILKRFLSVHYEVTSVEDYHSTIHDEMENMHKRIKSLVGTAPLYERYDHLMTVYLDMSYTGKVTQCDIVGCPCYYFSHTWGGELMETFLVDFYLYTLQLRPATHIPCIDNI